jgi:hypothetical protein
MKSLVALLSFIFLSCALLVACNRHPGEAQNLQQQVDSLRLRVNKLYKPGMGEIMGSIQLHHAKLWFAGENKNWPLAGYNESLIQSAFKKIQLYHGETAEARDASMIDPAMDRVTKAIGQKDVKAFESSFIFLTTTCNNCHAVTNHAFNVITIPVTPPVGNQDFKIPVK